MSKRHISILIILLISGVFNYKTYSLQISESSINNRRTPARAVRARVIRRQPSVRPRPVHAVVARRSRKKINSIKASIGQNFILSLKRKNIDGVWELKNYSKKLLELVENRVSVRDTYFIFRPVKKGVATVRVVFKTGNRVRGRETYLVKVLEQSEYSAAIQRIEERRIAGLERSGSSRSRGGQAQRQPERISLSQNASAVSQSTAESNSENESSDPEKEKNDFELINNLFIRKAYNEAASEASKFMKKYQSSKYLVDVIIIAGKSYGAINEHNKAVDLYTKYIDKVKNPNVTYPVYFARAASYWKLNKNNDAQIEYIKMLGIFKNRPELIAKAHLLLGKLYIKMNKKTMGLFELEKIIKNHPDLGETTAEAYYILGSYYYKTRGIENYEKSYMSFKKLYISFPESRFADPARRMARYLKVNYIDFR